MSFDLPSVCRTPVPGFRSLTNRTTAGLLKATVASSSFHPSKCSIFAPSRFWTKPFNPGPAVQLKAHSETRCLAVVKPHEAALTCEPSHASDGFLCANRTRHCLGQTPFHQQNRKTCQVPKPGQGFQTSATSTSCAGEPISPLDNKWSLGQLKPSHIENR